MLHKSVVRLLCDAERLVSNNTVSKQLLLNCIILGEISVKLKRLLYLKLITMNYRKVCKHIKLNAIILTCDT